MSDEPENATPEPTTPMEPGNIITMPSGIDVQLLTPDYETVDPGEPTVLECMEKAKLAWLADNPGLTVSSWEMISDYERDTYLEEQMSNAGFTKTMVNGYAHYNQ
mgnify:FL=1